MDAGKLIKDEFIRIGKNIWNNTGNQIAYYVGTTEEYGEIKEVTFHLIAEEISYDYKVFVVTIVDVQTVVLEYYTMSTREKEKKDFEIEKGLNAFKEKVHQYINGVLFKASIESLQNQIELRKQRNLPMRKAIIPGQACVAIFSDNSKQNVGWIRIEGDMVYYYTAKGLFDIWRPDMTAQEKINAEKLKQNTEQSLIASGHISVININDVLAIS